ncbi:hypothetical protein HID58_014544 [Brassica napus]|uniref:Squalene monooxygenase n=1 Tax=Brassica napus TaxID=3708 RepID=A0ABQ8DHJ7_BRANA|nr:hypothetical protein HID58_014544 [Brassica napus]
MDMYLTHVCLWTTLLSVVVTWAISHVSNRRKKTTKLTDTTAGQEIRYGGPDVIIVGAGVGGSALAYALAKDGRRVHVIERDMTEPVRMMGEFMQPGGRLMLAKLGLQDCLEEIDAQKSTCLSLYKDGKKAVVPFPCAAGRRNGKIFDRRKRSDQRSDIQEQFWRRNDGLCTSHCGMRRLLLKPSSAEVMSYQVGYISKNCQLEEPEYLHLVMAKPSFTMMYQLSSTEVRCGLELFPGQIPSIANGDMTNFLRNTMAPQVPPKLRKIFLKGIDEGAQIKVMPTKRMAATLSDKKGAIVLGDAFNMRHPSIASGMMVLLSDILILRRLLQPLEYLGDTNKVSEVIKSFYVIRKPMSATVNTLGTAFSQVLIASTDKAKEAMRQGCYDYLSSGGFGASGLMALLGGMNPRPLSLIYHLFVVTLSATVQLLSPFPSPLGIWHSLRLFGLSMKLLVPHLKAEGISQMLFPAYAAVYRKTYMTATTI